MDAAQDAENKPQRAHSPSSQARRKGRRLRSVRNARALIAATIRSVEADTAMDPAQRARLLFYGAQTLMTAISKCDLDRKLDDLIAQLRDAKKIAEERRRAEGRR